MSVPVVDPFGRRITYLQVSVTDRCDFRCVYCMAEDMTFRPRSEVLSFEAADLRALLLVPRATITSRMQSEPLSPALRD